MQLKISTDKSLAAVLSLCNTSCPPLYLTVSHFLSPSPVLISNAFGVLFGSLRVCLFVPTHTGTRNISLYLFIYALIKNPV